MARTIEYVPDRFDRLVEECVDQPTSFSATVKKAHMQSGALEEVKAAEMARLRASVNTSKISFKSLGFMKDKAVRFMRQKMSEEKEEASEIGKVTTAALELTSSKPPKRPSKALLEELKWATFDSRYFPHVCNVMWMRIADSEGKNWKHGHKGLALLDHLLRHGSDRIVLNACMAKNARIIDLMTRYENVEFGEAERKIRKSAKHIQAIVRNIFQLRTERLYAATSDVSKYVYADESLDEDEDDASQLNDNGSRSGADSVSVSASGEQENLQVRNILDVGSMQVSPRNATKRELSKFLNYRQHSLIDTIAPVLPDFAALHRCFDPSIDTSDVAVMAPIVPRRPPKPTSRSQKSRPSLPPKPHHMKANSDPSNSPTGSIGDPGRTSHFGPSGGPQTVAVKTTVGKLYGKWEVAGNIMDVLLVKGITTPNIFRQAGDSSVVQECMALINSGKSHRVPLHSMDALDLGSLLKKYLSSREPLFSFDRYREFLNVVKNKEKLVVLFDKISELDPVNVQCLRKLLELLIGISDNERITRMDRRSLAYSFGPALFRPLKDDPMTMVEDMKLVNKIVHAMLHHVDRIVVKNIDQRSVREEKNAELAPTTHVTYTGASASESSGIKNSPSLTKNVLPLDDLLDGHQEEEQPAVFIHRSSSVVSLPMGESDTIATSMNKAAAFEVISKNPFLDSETDPSSSEDDEDEDANGDSDDGDQSHGPTAGSQINGNTDRVQPPSSGSVQDIVMQDHWSEFDAFFSCT